MGIVNDCTCRQKVFEPVCEYGAAVCNADGPIDFESTKVACESVIPSREAVEARWKQFELEKKADHDFFKYYGAAN